MAVNVLIADDGDGVGRVFFLLQGKKGDVFVSCSLVVSCCLFTDVGTHFTSRDIAHVARCVVELQTREGVEVVLSHTACEQEDAEERLGDE